MKNKTWETIVKITFFGAIWGIIEATLGYALHFLPALIAGSIMFPMVMFILYHAYKSLGSRKAIILVGVVAIMIKATNLFLPLLNPAKAINPMIAMFIQSLLAFAIMPMLNSDKVVQKVSGVVIASISWRLVMVLYYAFNYATTGFMDFRIASFDPAFSFVVTEGLISAVFAIGLIYLTNPIKSLSKLDKTRISPLISTALLVIALVLTLVKF